MAQAQSDAVKAEQELNAEIKKAEVNARLEVETEVAKKQFDAEAEKAAATVVAVPPVV